MFLQHLSTFAGVRREFGNDWTEAVVSANNKVLLRVSFHLILQSYYIRSISTTEWLFKSMPVKNCYVTIKHSGRRESANVANWKRIIMGRHRSRGFWGKKTLNCHILNVVYVQYMEIKHLQAVLCFRWTRKQQCHANCMAVFPYVVSQIP